MANKVLFTASSYSHILHFHLPYLRSFKERGWTVHVACGGEQEELPWVDEQTDLPLRKKMFAPGNLRAATLLRKKMAKEGYDLLCTHTSLAAFFSRLALVGLKKRPAVVNMVHGYLFDGDTPWCKRTTLLAAERMVSSWTDLVLTMNDCDNMIARKYRLGKRISTVPGVGVDFTCFDGLGKEKNDLRRELGIPQDAVVLLYAAEFSARKNQTMLVRSMKELPEWAVLILAGEGVLRERCRNEACRLGVERRIIFPGYIKDIPPWYAAADIVITSSRSEGLPFHVLEAMCAGTPVVASRVKGHEDLIEHGVTGLLYPFGDARACAEQIGRLMNDAELRRTLAENARKNVLQYDLTRVLPLVMKEYESVLPQSVGRVK